MGNQMVCLDEHISKKWIYDSSIAIYRLINSHHLWYPAPDKHNIYIQCEETKHKNIFRVRFVNYKKGIVFVYETRKEKDTFILRKQFSVWKS